MGEHKTRTAFKNWLENLQQESWQLELIISSVLLYVLTEMDESVSEWFMSILVHAGEPIVIFYQMIPLLLLSAISIAQVNLIIHIFLRGFWIGCIGLRYVSNEIDVDSLGYRPTFTKYLKKLDLDFDRYLEELEKICSIIFSFTFLIIFGVFSIFSVIFFILLVGSLANYFDNKLVKFLRKSFILLILISAFFNLLDFALLGWFRKKKYISTLFYPFYRFFNLFTFSWIYRPLFYNFIDNSLGRTYIRLVIPYILILGISNAGISLGSYPFLPDENENSQWILPHQYDDLRLDFNDGTPFFIVTIPSVEVKENFLPVFLKHDSQEETGRVISELCPDLRPNKRSPIRIEAFEGFKEGWSEHNHERRTSNMNTDSALLCISLAFDLKIDSVAIEKPVFHFHKHPELKAFGLLTYIDISSFEKGDHVLVVEKKTNFKDKEFSTRKITVPFVKFN